MRLAGRSGSSIDVQCAIHLVSPWSGEPVFADYLHANAGPHVSADLPGTFLPNVGHGMMLVCTCESFRS